MKNVFKLLTLLSLTTCLSACNKEKDKIPFTSIEILGEEDPVTIRVDGECTFVAEAGPAEGNEDIIWETTDPDIVEIINTSKGSSNTGAATIKGLKEGSAMVMASTPEGVCDAVNVIVDVKYREPEELFLDHKSISLEKGEYGEVRYTLLPENCDAPRDENGNEAELTWEIEDEKIASIDWEENDYCSFEALSIGKTKLICSWGKFKEECEITVTEKVIPATAITIAEGNTSVTLGCTFLLTALIIPSNASNQDVTWTVEDTKNILFIGATGNKGGFAAMNPGKTKVTAAVPGTELKATVTVEVKTPPLPEGAVDMGYRKYDGTPIYFRKCNLGSDHEADAGKLYAWADPDCYYVSKNPYIFLPGKEAGYVQENYKWYDAKSKKWLKYNWGEGGLRSIELADDAAHKALGGNWRTPSAADLLWLKTYCDWEETQMQGVHGMTFTSKEPGFEGTSIFLPCGGYLNGTENLADGSFEDFKGKRYYMGCYFANALYSDKAGKAITMDFYDGDIYIRETWCHMGESIRPVWEGYNL